MNILTFVLYFCSCTLRSSADEFQLDDSDDFEPPLNLSVDFLKTYPFGPQQPPDYPFKPFRIKTYYIKTNVTVMNSDYRLSMTATDSEWDEIKMMVDWTLNEVKKVRSTVLFLLSHDSLLCLKICMPECQIIVPKLLLK